MNQSDRVVRPRDYPPSHRLLTASLVGQQSRHRQASVVADVGQKNRQCEYFTYLSDMKILSADPLPDFRLHLYFSDGTERTVDVSDLAGVGVFQAWLNPGVFEQVRVTDYGSLAWPDELDLCSDALYLRATGKEPEDIFPALKHSLSHA